MKPDRVHLLSVVSVEISSATADIDNAVLQRRWRDYCRQLLECLENSTEEDLPKIAERHFRECNMSYRGYQEESVMAIRRQGEFASHHRFETPTEDQRVTDVVLAVRSGEIPYEKLIAALEGFI